MKRYFSIILLLLLITSCSNTKQYEKLNTPDSLPAYQLIKDWPHLPQDYNLGNPTGIGLDSAQHIFVFHRAGRTWPLIAPMPGSLIPDNTILEIDKDSGKIINSWGSGLFIMPHGLTVDRNDNVWVTDVGLHQVFKFSYEGKLLMKLGEAKIAGNDKTHFNRPTDVAVAADGSFYVSDGYNNSRIIKFSSTGQYLFEWGKRGNAPGEFNIPHNLDLDDKGNVYVADRENSRVQAFDANGKFIKEWKKEGSGKIYSVVIDNNHRQLITIDYRSTVMVPEGSDVLIFDSTGTTVAQFGRTGLYDGPVCRYHDVAIDKDGNIYTVDILDNKIQKFKKMIH